VILVEQDNRGVACELSDHVNQGPGSR
jgi:hypothetical protein